MIEITLSSCCFFSTSPIHPSFSKYAILLNPVALSCLQHKGVGASDLLKGEEIEVGQLVPGEVEVVAHPGVPVVPHCSPVLRASLPTGPFVAHLANILRWLSQASPCSMGAGHTVTH